MAMGYSARAGGTINRCRAVKIDTTADNYSGLPDDYSGWKGPIGDVEFLGAPRPEIGDG